MVRRLAVLIVALAPSLARGEPSGATTPRAAPPLLTSEAIDVEAFDAPLFVSGALVFAGTYTASVAVAVTTDHTGGNQLYVPVVGPWIALDEWGNCAAANPSCGQSAADKVLLVADGVFQAVGLVAMIDSLLAPAHYRVNARTADHGIHVSPSRNGMTVFGHF